MAKRTYYTVSNSFAAGQLSEAAQDAIGIDVWSAGVARASNVAIQRDGGLRTRAPFVRPVGELPVPDLAILSSWTSDAFYVTHTLARGVLIPGNLLGIRQPGAGIGFRGEYPLGARIRAIRGYPTRPFLRFNLVASHRLRAITLHGCRLAAGTWKGSDDKLIFEVWLNRSSGGPVKISEGDDPLQPWNFAPGIVSRDITIQLDRGSETVSTPYTGITSVEIRLRSSNVAFPVELKLTGVTAFADSFTGSSNRAALIAAGAVELSQVPDPSWRLVPWVIKGAPIVLALGVQQIRVYQFLSDGSIGPLLHSGPSEKTSLGEWHFTPRQLKELTWAVYRSDLLLMHQDFPHPLRVQVQPFQITPLALSNIPDATQATVDAATAEVDTGSGPLRIANPTGARLVPQGILLTRLVRSAMAAWSDIQGARSYDVMWDTKAAYDADPSAWLAARNNSVNVLTGTFANTTSTDHVISGLTGGTEYVVSVRARYADGPSNAATPALVTPFSFDTAKLQGLTATVSATAVTGTIALAWTALANASGYQVQYRIAGVGLAWADIPNQPSGLATNASFLGTGGIQYDFRGRGLYSGARVGDWSNEVRQIAPSALPKAAGLEANDGFSDGAIDLSWAEATGEPTYEYRWRSGSGAWTTVSSTTNSVTFVGTAGTSYSFQVRYLDRFNRAGEWSNIVSHEARNTSPESPAGLTVVQRAGTAGSSLSAPGLNLSWSASTGASSYVVRARGSSTTVWTTFPAQAQRTHRSYGTELETYEFQVKAQRAHANDSDWSESVTGTVPIGRPAAPRVVATPSTSVSGRIGLTWGGVHVATGYQVRYRVWAASFRPQNPWTTTQVLFGTSTTFDGIPGSEYEFQVQALRGALVSGWGIGDRERAPTIGGTSPPPTSLSAPSGLSATASGSVSGQISLSWNSVAGATSYRWRRRTGSGSWTEVSAGSLTSAGYSGTPGTTYQFQVRAERGAVVSPWSGTVSRQAPNVSSGGVPTPTGLAASASSTVSGRILLSWNAIGNASGYRWRRRATGTTSWTTSGTLSSTTTSATFNGTLGTTYEFQVAGRRGTDWSPWSSSVNRLAGGASVRPGVPSGLTVANSAQYSRTINVSWGAVSAATQYQLRHRQRVGAGAWTGWTGVPKQSGRTYTLRSGTVGLTYEFQVRASNSAGDGAWSAGVSVTTVNLPIEAPRNLRGTLGALILGRARDYRVDWDSVTGAQRYEVNTATDRFQLPGQFTAWAEPTPSEFTNTNTFAVLRNSLNQTIRVRVRAYNGSVWSAWSDTFEFTV